MNRNSFITYIFCIMTFVFVFAFPSDGAERAAPFRIAAGDGSTLTMEDLSGKIVLCFYETRDTTDKNSALKDELRKFRDQLFEKEKDILYVLPVVDCSGASRLFIGKWKDSLIRESEKAGYTVYGDWDGKMRDDNKFLRNESNFALINKDGSITYLTHGLIEEREISLILRKVRSLMGKEVLF